MKIALLGVVLAGCSSLGQAIPGGDGGMSNSDAPNRCDVNIQTTPSNPEAGDHVHAAAVLSGFDGVPTYAWAVDGVPSTTYEAFDDSAIGFDATTAGTHDITVTVSGGTTSCQTDQLVVVSAQGSATALYRLRVVPPSSVAPPYESEIVVHAGTPTLRDVPLDPGQPMSGTITSGMMGVPAYVQLVPASGPPIEAFSAMTTGAFSARVALAPYQVIVVPELSGLAPRAFTWAPGNSFDFAVDAGSTITGSVSAPGGGPLVGATVQLTSGGVPSTVATTKSDGTFTLLAAFAPGAQVTATVVPPAASGLARLTATSATFNLAALAVTYNAATPCDLGGDVVQRGGNAQPGAQVTVVGSTGAAGTIGGVTAAGSVVATATANSSGVLPSLPIPSTSGLSAVVQIAAGDLAVATVMCGQPINAPAPVASTGVVLGATGSPIAGVQVEAVPIGALALATLSPVAGTSTADGRVTLALASGASYQLRVVDPSAHAAPLFASSVTALPATMSLGAALAVSGTVSVIGGTNAVAGAAVELLCAACTGLDAERPIAQAATDVQGDYVLAVPDPGSM